MITGIGFPMLPHGFPQWIHPAPAKSCPMRSRFVADQLPCGIPEIAPRRKTGVTAADAPGLVVHGKGRSIVHATDVAKVLWNWERNGVEPLEVWHWIFSDILQEFQEYIKSCHTASNILITRSLRHVFILVSHNMPCWNAHNMPSSTPSSMPSSTPPPQISCSMSSSLPSPRTTKKHLNAKVGCWPGQTASWRHGIFQRTHLWWYYQTMSTLSCKYLDP